MLFIATGAEPGAEPEPENVNGTSENVQSNELNVSGLVSIIVFYLVVLAVGVWAGWKQRRENAGKETDQEEVMLAGRNIGLFVGVLTMGATWVGGGFINGAAEATYSKGLINTIAPFGYGLSLILNGRFFARKMRDARYVTMIDPFTQKYGRWGALQAFPSAISEVLWSASILAALGSTLQVILGIDTVTSIVASAIIAVLYTLLGGLISVAYTDVFQLFFIAFGLFLALPFALLNPRVDYDKVTDIFGGVAANGTWEGWAGVYKPYKYGTIIDTWIQCLLGGIPWQCYFQRVLSSKTAARAEILSYGGGLIALVMAAPSVVFGAIAKAADFTTVNEAWGPAYVPPPGQTVANQTSLILPLSLQYLTPTWVSFFGLGAVSAAVMSSTDSSMLSASTMLARNFYKVVIRPRATEKEVLIVLWICICLNCGAAMALAILYQSTYDLFVLCGDFVFVMVFPQLLLVIYLKHANTYGSVFSFFIGLLLRLLCGDKTLGIPPAIEVTYKTWNHNGTWTGDDGGDEWQRGPDGALPFRTILMLVTLLIHVGVSELTHYLFTKRKISLGADFFSSFKHSGHGKIVPANSRLMHEEHPLDEINGKKNDDFAKNHN